MSSAVPNRTKSAIVTGGSRGIGLAIARVLADEGYALTLVSRNPERLEATAAKFVAEGYDVHAVVADVQHEDQLRNVVDVHRSRFEQLDVLVNNAGFGIHGPIENMSTSSIDNLFSSGN